MSSRYQDYRDSMENIHNHDLFPDFKSWAELTFESERMLIKAILDLTLPPSDYSMMQGNNLVYFRHKSDHDAVVKLLKSYSK